MRKQRIKIKRSVCLALVATFLATIFATLHASVMPTAYGAFEGGNATDSSSFTLVFPEDDRTGSQLRAAARDGGIGPGDANGILAQTNMLTRGGRLGTAALGFAGDRSDKNDVPTYKLDYYCTPTDNYKLSIKKPNTDVPYIRYTMGVTVLKSKNWKGIVDDPTYETRVGLLGDNNVGTVHFPEYVDNSNAANGQPAGDFDLPAGGNYGNGLRSGVDVGRYYFEGARGGTNLTNYSFKLYDNQLPDYTGIGDVFTKCLPNPRGNIGNKTSNFNQLATDEQKKWSDAAKAAGISEDARTAGTASSPTGGATNPDCQSGGDPLNWILCPIFDGVAFFSDWLFQQIVEPLLRTTPVSTDPDSSTYKIWSNFRIYGNIFLVIALLVIVFGQSIGGGLVDAYTAKKVLPRLVIATILINLSLYIVAALVDITNIVGGSIGTLMTAPLQDAGAFKITPSGVQAGTILGGSAIGVGLVALVGGAAAFSGFLSFGLLFIVMPVVFGLLAAFVTLVLRQAFIIALVLVSPVAFALYCLPNTQQYFRKWWDFLIQTLLVYPIVIVFFAVADILSVTATGTDPNNIVAGSLGAIIGFVLQFLPLIFIPYAFRLAGGALGRVHELMSNTRKRSQEAIKGNPNDLNSLRNKAKRRAIAGLTSSENRVLKEGHGPGASAWQRRRARLLNTLDGRVNERQSRFTQEGREIADRISGTGDDSDHYAANWFSVPAGQVAPTGLTSRGVAVPRAAVGHERFFNSKGQEINEAYARMAENKMSANAYEAGGSLEYPVRKIQSDEDIANFRRGFAATAVRQNLNGGEMMGMHAAATFAHKDKLPELWYGSPEPITDPQTGNTVGVKWNDVGDDTPKGRENLGKMTGEMYNVRQGFQLGSVRGSSMRAMEQRRASIQRDMDAGTPVHSDDAKFFVESTGIIDQMIQKGIVTREGEAGPEMSASGATPATQDALKAMIKNSRYNARGARVGTNADGTPVLSPNEHVIYKEQHVESAVNHGAGATSRDDAIDAAAVPIIQPMPRGVPGPPGTVGRTVQVTGGVDRTDIPRSA